MSNKFCRKSKLFHCNYLSLPAFGVYINWLLLEEVNTKKIKFDMKEKKAIGRVDDNMDPKDCVVYA